MTWSPQSTMMRCVAGCCALLTIAGCTAKRGQPTVAASGRGIPADSSGARPSQSSPSRPSPTATAPAVSPAAIPVFTATVLAERILTPLSRLAAFSLGGRIFIAGGLTTGSQTTANIEVFDPAKPAVTAITHLEVAVHDAAVGVLGRVALVVGGGSSSSTDVVQAVRPDGSSSVVGHLPRPRSDDSAAVWGKTLYVLGGYDGVHELPDILATADGTTFRQLGVLPETVRYGTACPTSTALWMIGGQHDGVTITDVQRIDTGTGIGAIVGQLPHRLAHAACAVVAGHLLVMGGTDGQTTQNTVYEVDTSTGAVSTVGHLPEAVSDMGITVLGETAYVVGGDVTTATRGTAASAAIVAITLSTP